MSEKLPDFVREKITLVQRRTNSPREDVEKEYWEIFNSEFVQKDEQFTNEEQRHRYSASVLSTRLLQRTPVKEYTVIPIGFGNVRIPKGSGQRQSDMFVLAKDANSKEYVFKRVAIRGRLIDKMNEITPFTKYQVKVGEFRSGSNDLIADDRAKFESPQQVKGTIEQIVAKVNPRTIKIKDAVTNTSEVGSDGYVKQLDWRKIRGIILSVGSGTREDGTPWGSYRIGDDSVADEDPKVTDDGKILFAGLTIWLNPMLMSYSEESECDFYGTITLNKKTGEPSMNCFLILPIHAMTAAVLEKKEEAK